MGKRKKKKQRALNRQKAPLSGAPSQSSLHQKAPLSLCMIVKNESHFLPDCLASVRDLVREIIIVDTGSTDNTVDIARQYGAKIYFTEWENNFAKARNLALKKATQPWILYLDADERLYPQYHAIVRQAIESNQADAFYVNILSYLSGKLGNVPHTQKYPRIFKKLPGVRFEGKIHEQITPSLTRAGARFKNLDVVIEHLGYNLSPEEIDAKVKRNLKFLEEQVAEEPENWYALFQLGQTYIVDGQTEKGLAVLHQLLKFNNLTVPIAASALALIGNQLFLQKDYAAARDYIHKALQIAPRQRLGYFLLSEIEAALEHWPEAIQALEDYLKNENLTFSDLGVDKILDHKLIVFRLARNWIYLNQYSKAADVFQTHFFRQGIVDEEIVEKFLQILSKIDVEEVIKDHLTHFLQALPHSSESELYFRMGITFCQEKGLISLQKHLLSRAVELFPENALFWYVLGNIEAQTGNHNQAISAYQQAIHYSPTLYEAYYNAAVLEMKKGHFTEAIAWFEKIAHQFPHYREEANRRIAALLIKNGQLEAALTRLGISPAKTQEVLKMPGGLPNM